MEKFIYGFFFGFGLFSLLEPLFINFIYFSNLDLFNVLILNKKNREKIRRYYEKND